MKQLAAFLLFTTLFSAYEWQKSVKKINLLESEMEKAYENKEGIYTQDDIYYIEGNRLTSEGGLVMHFRSHKELQSYLGTVTANESKISDNELYRIISNYGSIGYNNGKYLMSVQNPYTKFTVNIQTNRIDTVMYSDEESFLVHYFQD